jgi:hypothetical protein
MSRQSLSNWQSRDALEKTSFTSMPPSWIISPEGAEATASLMLMSANSGVNKLTAGMIHCTTLLLQINEVPLGGILIAHFTGILS